MATWRLSYHRTHTVFSFGTSSNEKGAQIDKFKEKYLVEVMNCFVAGNVIQLK